MGVDCGYGSRQVLFSVSIEANNGDTVAIIGPNGSGKSTLLKAIMGSIPVSKGSIVFRGMSLKGVKCFEIARRGLSYVPQGKNVFGSLSVLDNLRIGAAVLSKGDRDASIQEVWGVFPVLREQSRQRADRLSGGERQMLALARSLVSRPALLMLDEPSLGLSPRVVEEVLQKICDLNRALGITVIIVEQKVSEVLDICTRVYSLKLGMVAFAGVPGDLKSDSSKLKELFI